MENVLSQIKAINTTKTLIAILLAVILVIAFNFALLPATDWSHLYRPAAVALVSGRSPYDVERFTNAPWMLIPMVPLLVLPETLSRAVLALCALISLLIVSYKLGANRIGMTFLLLSPPVVSLILDGNIDWMVAIGFILPPQIGLFFLAVKPKLGSRWQSSGFSRPGKNLARAK